MVDFVNNEDTPRYRRSPCFSSVEVTLLLKLVDKYKHRILTKSTNGLANRAKEVAWLNLTKEFNKSDLGHIRSVDTLKGKWENLKKLSKKSTKNLLDSERSELDDIISQVIALITASESIGCNDNFPDILDEDMDQNEVNDNVHSSKDAESDTPKDVESDVDDDVDKNARFRSQNFSPRESKLLLQCVRKEKKHVFTKDITSKAIEIKNQAWTRISDSYNKLSPQKRSVKCLRMKFSRMKKMARKIGTKDMFLMNLGKQGKHEGLVNEDDFQSIKKEPLFEDKMDDDSDQCSDQDENHFNDLDGEDKSEAPPDPLSCVLNGDSGIGSSSSQICQWNWSDNKEIVKLQKELLNYQMETAKLERKRVEEAMLEDQRERESRAAERALRLRAARLSAEASALRLPALRYHAGEELAKPYLEPAP